MKNSVVARLALDRADGLLEFESLREAISRTEIDVVEAFMPPPMGDVGVAEAKAAWPDKVIWANFPGSVFMLEPDEIGDFTVRLCRVGGSSCG